MVAPSPPDSLAAGGVALWTALATDAMPEHLVALLTEACRARDRLDKLDRILAGDVGTWLELRADFDGDSTYVHVDGALLKANTTAGVLKNLLDKIPAPAAKPAAKTGEGTALDQLAARRQTQTSRSRTTSRRRTK